jgi:ADP-dependent NAD(P)H-hydrate dehydratase / NAD(P)H-hydrate epimerase
MTLPTALYRSEEVRQLDALIMAEQAISGYLLMQRAGAAAFNLLTRTWPAAHRVAILCGVGNNGGDGFVLAQILENVGIKAIVWQVGEAERIQGAALEARNACLDAGIKIQTFTEKDTVKADVVVDALLGTGLNTPVTGIWAAAVAAMNQGNAPVLALDIPSGLHADTGAVQGVAVRAHKTITFIALKQGLLTGAAADYVGHLTFAGLETPRSVYRKVPMTARRLMLLDVIHCLPRRARAVHKGAMGHVLIIGGDSGFVGAVRLAAEAAARSGAGLVSVATRAQHANFINIHCPEIMSHGVESSRALLPLLARATVVAIGPGLGQSRWAQKMLSMALASKLPLIVDADALNLLAHKKTMIRSHWIITPHPGEAARLLHHHMTAEKVQQDRFAAATQLCSKLQAVVVLKGAGTLVQAPDTIPAIVTTGNPGMASGGMGDVLTGLLAALVAQGLSLADAAYMGAMVHGAAADSAAKQGERGLLASDLLPHIRALLNYLH